MHLGEFAMWFWVASLALIPLFFWYYQVKDLMSRPDSAFPGHNDKLIWALFLIFMHLLGAIIYCLWKRQIESDALREQKLQDMREETLRNLGRSGTTPESPPA